MNLADLFRTLRKFDLGDLDPAALDIDHFVNWPAWAKALAMALLYSVTVALISERGSMVVDDRTNSIVVTDTSAKLVEIRELIEKVDIPICQIMIEARIVIASSNINKQLGIRWGGGYLNAGSDQFTSVAGVTASVMSLSNQLIGGANPIAMLTAPLIDLGVAEATSGRVCGRIYPH